MISVIDRDAKNINVFLLKNKQNFTKYLTFQKHFKN